MQQIAQIYHCIYIFKNFPEVKLPDPDNWEGTNPIPTFLSIGMHLSSNFFRASAAAGVSNYTGLDLSSFEQFDGLMHS